MRKVDDFKAKGLLDTMFLRRLWTKTLVAGEMSKAGNEITMIVNWPFWILNNSERNTVRVIRAG